MEDKFYIEIGELIRKERRLKNYSQHYLAVKLGITQNGYCKIEAGKSKCSGRRLFQILDLLELDPSEVSRMISGINTLARQGHK